MTSRRRRPLSALQAEVLSLLVEQPPEDWWRPMDLGGTDASGHSAALARLCRLGLVERVRRTLMNYLGSRRGSYLYRATAAGRCLVRTT